MKDQIVMQDWAGNILFEGHFEDKQVDKVLDANRCLLCGDMTKEEKKETCPRCDGTGYHGDFEVYWKDKQREDNVYEFINY